MRCVFVCRLRECSQEWRNVALDEIIHGISFRFFLSLSGYPCKKSIHLPTQRIAQEQKKNEAKNLCRHILLTRNICRVDRMEFVRRFFFSSLRSNCKSNSDNRSIIQRLNGQFTGVKSVGSANATIIVTNKLNIFRYKRFFHPLAAWAVDCGWDVELDCKRYTHTHTRPGNDKAPDNVDDDNDDNVECTSDVGNIFLQYLWLLRC